MSKAQEDLLAEYFGHVVVMLDGDEAGREAAQGIADRLRRVVYRVDLTALPHNPQPDQLSQRRLTGTARLDSCGGVMNSISQFGRE